MAYILICAVPGLTGSQLEVDDKTNPPLFCKTQGFIDLWVNVNRLAYNVLCAEKELT